EHAPRIFFRPGGFGFVLRLNGWRGAHSSLYAKTVSIISPILSLFPVRVGSDHEVGLMLGGLVSQDRGSAPNNISLSRGTAHQANQCRTQSGSAYAASRSISAAVRTSSFGDGLACGGEIRDFLYRKSGLQHSRCYRWAAQRRRQRWVCYEMGGVVVLS